MAIQEISLLDYLNERHAGLKADNTPVTADDLLSYRVGDSSTIVIVDCGIAGGKKLEIPHADLVAAAKPQPSKKPATRKKRSVKK